MNNYFEVKVKYQKLDQETGKTKNVTEPYLVDAISFSEAEERIYKSLEEVISGEFVIKSIARSNMSDVFEYEHGEYWHKCTVKYVDVDEESGKEKKVSNQMLVTADTPKEAYDRIQECLKEMIVPFEITVSAQSPIVDVFEYENDLNTIQDKVITTESKIVVNEETGEVMEATLNTREVNEIQHPQNE